MSELNATQRLQLLANWTQPLTPEGAQYLVTAAPAYDKKDGTNFPVSRLLYTPASNESAYWKFAASEYGSGNITLDVYWYADTDTNGAHACVWEASIAAITAGDAQDVETKALAAATNASSAPSTTSHGLVKTTVTVSNLDSVAAGDEVWIKIKCPSAANTLTGDAVFLYAVLTYSRT